MTDSRAEDILREQSTMESERANFDGHWTEVAERVLPSQRDFNNTKRTGGEKLNELIFDDTAPLALDRFAAALESMLVPRTQRWHELRALDDEINELPEVKAYLYAVTTALFRARYAPSANYAGQMHELFQGLGAFGNGTIFIDDHVGRGLRYRSCALAETYFAENYQGVVDTVHRRFEMTARQWVQKFGDQTPPTIARAAETEPHRKFELIHCFKPRGDANWSRLDYKGMAYASYYVSFEGRALLREEGYRTMRYAVSRYTTAPREIYGRSPAMKVLGTIKGVNEEKKTLLRAGQLSAEPPMLLSDDGSLSSFKMTPRAANYGALGPSGEVLARPLETGANMPITQEMIQDDRRVINDAFLVTLFQVALDSPDITATQALLKAEEKGALLAPTMGRQQSEVLGPQIAAELDILSMAGILPEMPDALAEAGGAYAIEYTSPLSRAQKAGEGVAILRTLEQAGPILQADPSAAVIFQGKGVQLIRTLGDVNGVPPILLNTDEEIAALKESNDQQQELESMLAAAPVAAGAAKSIAEANALMSRSPALEGGL